MPSVFWKVARAEKRAEPGIDAVGAIAAVVQRVRQASRDAPGGDPRHELGEMAVGARRQSAQHVVFGEPGRPARAFDQERALLAIERTEVALIAGRHLDARHGADVEARLVEHEDDVRQPLPRLAGRGRGRRKAIADDAVRFQKTARREIEQRERAGTRELRHVVGRLERLLAVHRYRKRQRAQRSEASNRPERGRPQPHAKRIEPPEQREQRQHDSGHGASSRGEPRKDRQQE